jgi:hypothetical protein
MEDADDRTDARAPATAAREQVLSEGRETVAAVLRRADEVAATWDGDAATDRAAVVGPLSRRLTDAGLLARCSDLLDGAVAATELSLAASPVPAPPYVVVTSRGPVLRGTTDAGRLVVEIRAFAVERDGGIRYVRGPADPEAAISVAVR